MVGDWNGLEKRLMNAMGLAPAAVTLSLVACGGPDAERESGAAPDVETEQVLELNADRSDVLVERAEEPLPVPWVEALTDPNAGHASMFAVHDAVPFERIDLMVHLDDLPAEIVASGYADADGVAVLYGFTPDAAQGAAGAIFTVVHPDMPKVGSSELTASLSGLTPDHPDVAELHPMVDPTALAFGERRLACVPAMEYGNAACTAVADFHVWEGVEIVSYALDDSLPPELSAKACMADQTFADSCCYYVEFWDTMNGSADDACVRPGQGGGGGGGGGWGWDEGRPFTVDGVATNAEVRKGQGWSTDYQSAFVAHSARIRARAASAWLDTAQAEHASIASFSRFNLQLMQLGAPSDLILRSTLAIADEIRHARDAFGVASALAGVELTAGVMPMVDALSGVEDVRAALLDAIREGCVNETVSAAFVREAARVTTEPELAAMLDGVAEEEARHAELSWAFARWALQKHPELKNDVADLFASVDLGDAPVADVDRDALGALGVLTADAEYEIATQILERVVRPCAVALIAGV